MFRINNCWNMRHEASHWKTITNTGKPLWRRHLLFPQVHTDLFTSECMHKVFQMGWFLKRNKLPNYNLPLQNISIAITDCTQMLGCWLLFKMGNKKLKQQQNIITFINVNFSAFYLYSANYYCCIFCTNLVFLFILNYFH